METVIFISYNYEGFFVPWLCPYGNFVNSHSDSCSKVLKFTTMSNFITLFWYSFDIYSCFKIMENIIFLADTPLQQISHSAQLVCTSWHMLSAIRRYEKICQGLHCLDKMLLTTLRQLKMKLCLLKRLRYFW